MGGGDLNLKKSWHPSTLRNIERVWKAEQKHEVERQKIEQLQKELAEERAREEMQTYAEDQGVIKKKDERLDWMYQGPAAMVNREEYLLGRKVDKTLETLQQIENGGEPSKEGDNDIGGSMFSSQNLSGTATVDLANKIREDPLFSIMKKEKEERKNLLSNPVKMKQLQQILKASLSSQKGKKSKKSKKKRHSESDSDSEMQQRKKKYYDSDSDSEKQHKKKKKHRKTNSDIDDEKISYKESHKNNYTNHKYNGRDNVSTERRSSKYEYDRKDSSGKKHKYFQQDYRESSHRSFTYNHDSSNSSNHRNYESSHHKEYHQSHRDKSYDVKSYSKDYSFKDNKKSKLDSAERDRLLKEMQDNAKWRDDQRKRNTQRYKEEDEREEKTHKIDTCDFLKPMLSKAAGKGSLENRVKQKIFTIQRSSRDMDKNFARRD